MTGLCDMQGVRDADVAGATVAALKGNASGSDLRVGGDFVAAAMKCVQDHTGKAWTDFDLRVVVGNGTRCRCARPAVDRRCF